MIFPDPFIALTALSRLIRALFRRQPLLVSQEIEDERWRTCEPCERYEPVMKQCLECTCFLVLKIPLTHECCPKRKWKR